MSATKRFVEEFGLISQEGGDSRISGRIMGLLVVAGHELSLSQISERLGVSRASVSTNARQLARRGAIRLTAHAGDRQDYYQLSNLSYVDVIGEIAGRFKRHARTIQSCVVEMRDEDAKAAERAAGMQEFFEKSAEILDDWANSLRTGGTMRKDAK
ncbi:GbsR/MarR family transcriptional regulator [Devosia sp. SL43]|uniref:GbsR/MarR family transcriptional regulator n=1 Tax=Devosia sp. SL43 TaxID=2806348 RepID=UPI001F225BCC|nr:MarR family transcriptional regulator [Devosia sp. SL43]UJW85121.1 MarR family transcriptional regulator [Devosia sp. SL43]